MQSFLILLKHGVLLPGLVIAPCWAFSTAYRSENTVTDAVCYFVGFASAFLFVSLLWEMHQQNKEREYGCWGEGPY